MAIERAYKARDVHFETVQDAGDAIIAVVMPGQIKPTGARGDTFSFFLDEKLLTKLIVQMAYSVQRRRATGRMWEPGATAQP